jgi:shikimate 5-dehydrogenase
VHESWVPVNTVAVQSGRLIGHNTDVTGFGRAVAGFLAASAGPIAVASASGLVNGTPIGMLPNRESPVGDGLLHSGLWVADAVYYPLWTSSVTEARLCRRLDRTCKRRRDRQYRTVCKLDARI